MDRDKRLKNLNEAVIAEVNKKGLATSTIAVVLKTKTQNLSPWFNGKLQYSEKWLGETCDKLSIDFNDILQTVIMLSKE